MAKRQRSKTVAVDLDGTLCYYDGWLGPYNIGEPLTGAKEFLQALQDSGYRILIFSCRSSCQELADAIRKHLDKHEMVYDDIFIGGRKPPASAFVDDRGVSCQPQIRGEKAYDKALKEVHELCG